MNKLIPFNPGHSKDLFIIKKQKGKQEPHYEIDIEMDSNDGDYMNTTLYFDVDTWNNAPDILFLLFMYLGQGYIGKFSHGEDWGFYYGHHFSENKHGLEELIEHVMSEFDMIINTEWGYCHSYTDITITYYDENNKKHYVEYPNIDDLFDSEEDMLKAIVDAYQEWLEHDDILDELKD